MLDNAYPFLESMLIHSTNDLELLSEICWALCRMFHIRSAQAGTPISSRFIQELVKLLDGVDRVEITTPVLRTITNIVACEDDVFIQKFIDAHIIPRLYSLVSQHNHFTSQLEAILVMANMTAGQTSQVQSVLDSNIFPVLINIVNSDPYSTSASSINADRLKRESIWVLGNATTYRQFDQLNTMMDMGVLDTLIRFLATNLVVKDPNTSWKAIQSILNFIEGGDLASSPSGYTPALASSSNAFVCHIRSQEWMLHTFAENIGCIDLALNTGLPLEGGRFTVTINNNGTSDSFMLTSKQLSNFKKARDALNLILTKWFTVWWNARMNGGSNGGLDDLVNSLENVQLD